MVAPAEIKKNENAAIPKEEEVPSTEELAVEAQGNHAAQDETLQKPTQVPLHRK